MLLNGVSFGDCVKRVCILSKYPPHLMRQRMVIVERPLPFSSGQCAPSKQYDHKIHDNRQYGVANECIC